MQAILIDADPSSRALLRRLLVRDFACVVTEADNGIDGLEAIERTRPDVIILDVRLPLLDGIRVLEMTRQASTSSSTPVIITALSPEREQVRRAVELGVADCILKPFEPGTLDQRVGRVVRSYLVSKPDVSQDNGVKDAVDVASTSIVGVTPTVVVADSQRDFRHFVASTLANKAIVRQAGSGLEALKMALSNPPTLVFVGQELGILSSDALVHELRRKPQLARSRVVGVAPKHQLDAVRQSAPYDAVIVRTFMPDLFMDSLAGILPTAGALSALRQVDPGLSEGLVSAVQLVAGSMFAVQLTDVNEAAPSVNEARVTSTVLLDVTGHGRGVALELECPLTFARQMCARATQVGADEVEEQDAVDTLSEIANMVSGRLKNRFAERGIAITCGLPSSRLATDAAAPSRDSLTCHFVEPEQGNWFLAALRHRAAASA